MAVVVVDENAECALEVAYVDDQQPVEALGACSADEACEAKYQPADLAADRRSAAPAAGVRPAASDEASVPAQERRRRDQKRPPARDRGSNRLAAARKSRSVGVSWGRHF